MWYFSWKRQHKGHIPNSSIFRWNVCMLFPGYWWLQRNVACNYLEQTVCTELMDKKSWDPDPQWTLRNLDLSGSRCCLFAADWHPRAPAMVPTPHLCHSASLPVAMQIKQFLLALACGLSDTSKSSGRQTPLMSPLPPTPGVHTYHIPHISQTGSICSAWSLDVQVALEDLSKPLSWASDSLEPGGSTWNFLAQPLGFSVCTS